MVVLFVSAFTILENGIVINGRLRSNFVGIKVLLLRMNNERILIRVRLMRSRIC